MDTDDADDARYYSDCAEFFPYTVDDFYALPEETQMLLRREARRLRRRREGEAARAVVIGMRLARLPQVEGDAYAALRELYPELDG